jgi:hypothetical protein
MNRKALTNPQRAIAFYTEELYKDEEICNNITFFFIAIIFSSFIASIFNCHSTSTIQASITK